MTTTTYTPNNLIAGSAMPIVSEGITLEADTSEMTLVAGTVLAKKSNDKFVIVDSGEEGEDVAYAILAEDQVVSANTDKVAVGYLTGVFNASKLVFGGSDTLATHKDAMRKIGIFVKSTISA